jgi:hypothetical protein
MREVTKILIIAEMILALVIIVPTFPGQGTQRNRSGHNHSPRVESFKSSKKTLDLCPFFPTALCSSSGTIVTLEVKASDQENDLLTYKYSVTAGTIVGTGASVNWDLSGSRLGNQTASVEVSDKRGGKESAKTVVELVVCGACDPPCPTLSVTCPTEVHEGEIAEFTATASADDSVQKLIYLWSHSNGKRVASDQGPKLQIKATGLPGDLITATVRVLGIDPACNYQASCESRIVKRSQ